jgi:hypothetical protein
MNIEIKKLNYGRRNSRWIVVEHPLRNLGRERILGHFDTRKLARIFAAQLKAAERGGAGNEDH